MRVTAIVDVGLRDVVATIVSDVEFVETGPSDFELREDGSSWVLTMTGRRESGRPAFVVARLIEVLNLRMAAAVGDRVALHAASIETSAGVVVLAGVSGAGKSTLAAAAVLAGYGYVADEISAVAVGDTCEAAAFHRPIGLRRGGAEAIGVTIPATDDGRFDMVYPWNPPDGTWLSLGGQVAAVAIVSRIDSSSALPTDTAVMLAPADAFARLMQHTVVPDVDSERADGTPDLSDTFRRVRQLVDRVPVFDLVYSTPADGLHTLASFVTMLPEPADKNVGGSV